MEQFEITHKDVIEALPTLESYKSFSITGRVIEAYEKRSEGKWHDVTLREQERQRAELELAKAKRTLAALEGDDETDINCEDN